MKLLAALGLLGLGGLAGGAGVYLLAPRPAPAPASPLDLPALYQRAVPAVVTVRTDLARLDELESRGTGTGFHLGEGYYVTSAHVVEGGSKFFVEGGDGVAETARLVGADRPSDIALLRAKVRPAALSWAIAAPTVGEWVFALGNPFGAAPGSLSLGVVSGLRRLVPGPSGTLVGLLQTDAALNQGNSGGPLLDAAGAVVGVNAAILSPSGGNAGVGFAVPAATARRIVVALRTSGKAAHPSLGVTGNAGGPAVLERVLPGSAAARAGLKDGDIVVAADGYELSTFRELGDVIAAQEPGATVNLRVRRAGNLLTVSVTLE